MVRRQRRPLHRRPRLAQRHDVNRRRIESHRLDDGDEIQIGKYKLSYLERYLVGLSEPTRRPAGRAASPSSRPEALTIGAVCKILSQEFDEISISKIRYLEDQKLLTPSGRRAATASTASPTSSGCGRSCACSATSSCRCG